MLIRCFPHGAAKILKFIYEEVISKILEEIPQGLNIYLYLDPYEEVDQLEVNCDGE